ncbi:MAG: AAA family ATPase [Ruminococcaceae bacterium]|nr:AAA family ATPase [Oscillospiraceae bacterium]
MRQGYKDMKCGLLGEKLGHSFSPMIHGELADYSYVLVEKTPEQVEDFVRNGELDAYNVTVPYKKTVMPFLDVISPEALSIGAVNTVVRGKDGKKYGYNTDYFGFCYMLDASGIEVNGKKALVFGTGGASATVCAVLRDKGVKSLVVVSIENNTPEFLAAHADAEIIVNATPVGMYPHNGASPVKLSLFPDCVGVLDVIYNPSKTALLLEAEARGIAHANGLSMLVAQAAKAFEFFTGNTAEAGACEKIITSIEAQTKNIILVGMPGCGKTTVGKLIAKQLGRPFYDADDVFTEEFAISPAEVIQGEGEEKFRQMEHEIAEKLGKLSGAVISCGGGVVTREYNYHSLHQNGTIIFLERALENLSKKGRPLSQSTPIEQLYSARIDAYRRFADIVVASTEVPENTADLMIQKLFEGEKI